MNPFFAVSISADASADLPSASPICCVATSHGVPNDGKPAGVRTVGAIFESLS